MSVTSGFFNSVNGDRRYSAEQMSSLFDGIINDGVFASIGTAFEVKAKSGKTVTVGLGRAWFNSIWVDNDAILSITANDAEILLSRYDAIVIEINHTSAVRAGTIKYIKGTASSNPQKPTMANTNEVHQYPLAYIYRPSGSTEITQSNITNCVGTSSCPYITGILQVQNIDKNVAQWEAQFNEWFDRMQDQLSEDAVGNLQRQIDELGLDLGEIRYASFIDDANSGDHMALLKANWENLEVACTYIVKLNSGYQRVAIVQKYATHDWGSVLIFGYGQGRLVYHELKDGVWDYWEITDKKDLANYLPLDKSIVGAFLNPHCVDALRVDLSNPQGADNEPCTVHKNIAINCPPDFYFGVREVLWHATNHVIVRLTGLSLDNYECKTTRIWTNTYYDGVWRGWEIGVVADDLANYLPLSGGKLTGNLEVGDGTAKDMKLIARSNTRQIALVADSNANGSQSYAGLYDMPSGKWLINSLPNGDALLQRVALLLVQDSEGVVQTGLGYTQTLARIDGRTDLDPKLQAALTFHNRGRGAMTLFMDHDSGRLHTADIDGNENGKVLTSADFVVTGSANEATLTINLD